MRTASFDVRLTCRSAVPVTIPYETINNGAASDAGTGYFRFEPTSGNLVFDPGETVKQIYVKIRDNVPNPSYSYGVPQNDSVSVKIYVNHVPVPFTLIRTFHIPEFDGLLLDNSTGEGGGAG